MQCPFEDTLQMLICKKISICATEEGSTHIFEPLEVLLAPVLFIFGLCLSRVEVGVRVCK
jgi:hypothetical protein